MKVDPALGIPKDDVTHWGISAVTGWRRNEKQRRVPSYERLTHPRADGTHLNEWPMSDCQLEIIRERWGTGEFRVHWLINDEEAADPADRRRSAGNGNIFKLDAAPEPEEAVVVLPPPAAFQQAADPMRSAFDFAKDLMGLADGRTRTMLDSMNAARPQGDGSNAQVLAEIAGLRAKIEADAAQRLIEDRHRAELAEKDRKIAELERAKEKAEAEAEKAGESVPGLDPDMGILEQLPVLAINGVMNLAKTHPDIAMSFVEKAAEFWEKRKSPVSRETPPPTGTPPAPAIAAQAPPAARPPVVVVPPVRRVENPLTPSQTAKAADPTPVQPPPGNATVHRAEVVVAE